MEMPKTLQQALIYFNDPDNCQRFMIDVLWPDGKVKCPRCGSEKVSYLANQRRWKCYSKHPRAQFSVKVGTIFERSPIGLDKWLAAMWLIVNCKNGVSSYEVHRAIGVTQKSAWFMLQRLRLALQGDDGGKLSGSVEVDETFIGGKSRFMHKHDRERKIHGTGGHDKVIVMGILERGGKVRTSVMPNR